MRAAVAKAVDAAQQSGMQMCHGAVVDGRGCRAACNRFSGRTGPYDKSLHAEAAALRRATNAKGATMYVVRVGATGELRESMPCNMCQIVMRKAGVRKCVFSTAKGVLQTMHL